MKHNVAFELDLTNPDEANVYNAIRNLDGIKNAIAQFRRSLKEMKDNVGTAAFAEEVVRVEELLLKSFGDNGVTI